MAHECNEMTNRRTMMPETVCVTVEQLREIEWSGYVTQCVGGDHNMEGMSRVIVAACPVCRSEEPRNAFKCGECGHALGAHAVVVWAGERQSIGASCKVCSTCTGYRPSDDRIGGHAADCWLAKAIAQAERLKGWKPKVGDRVRLKAMPDAGSYKVVETVGRMCRIGVTASSKVTFGIDGQWRYLAELMPEEE